jgi:hypothetical protein
MRRGDWAADLLKGRDTSGALAKIRFEATEDALYVANSGSAFDHAGRAR